MKKNLFYIAALCAAALVSCTPKELVIDEPNGGEEITDATALVHVTINASMDEATKAYIDDADGFAWKWAENDQLAVFDASNQKIVFTINSSTAGSSVAKFEADGVPSSFVPVKAVFPASAAGATPDEFNIKSTQSPSAYSIDPEAMVATADGEKVSDTEFNFYFEPAVSYFRFAVAAGVSKVILHTVGKDDTIAGDSRSVTVNLSGTEGKFWAAVNPAVYHGIRAFAYDGTSYTKKGADAAEIDLSAKGSGKNIGTVSGGTEVAVIENADALVSYLDGTPALDGYIVNDLDLTGKTVTTCASFAKTFDGQYHSIKNWTSKGVALFGTVTGDVNNIIVDKTCTLTEPASGDFSFIIKTLKGSAINCINEADISFEINGSEQCIFGGIVGHITDANALVQGCVNRGTIDITVATGSTAMGGTQYFGGIIGIVGVASTKTRLIECANEAQSLNVTATGDGSDNLKSIYIGGIAGGTGLQGGNSTTTSGFATSNYGTIDSCTNKANVSASWTGGTGGYFNVGGIIGFGQCQLLRCINRGSVSYKNSKTITNARPSVGGIAGSIDGPGRDNLNADGCNNYGSISLEGCFGNSSNAYNAGTGGVSCATLGGCFGVVGDSSVEIKNCDNYGTLSADTQMAVTAGSSTSFGGVVGWSKAAISGCKNLSTFTERFSTMARTAHIGGIVGYCSKPINNCESSATIEASHDCESLTIDGTEDYPKPVSNVGGIVGYALDDCAVSSCRNTGEALTLTDLTTDSRIGGVSGMQRSDVIGCSNSAIITVVRKKIVIEGYNYAPVGRYGGIIGYQNVNKTIKDNHNTGKMYITLDDISANAAVGGVLGIGQVVVTLNNCDNDGDITVNGGGIKNAVWFGGVAGATNVKKSKLVGCDNTGNLILSNAKSTSFSYFGGVWGYYKDGSNIMDSCSNTGDLTSTAEAKIRVGGLAAGLYGSVNNSYSTSVINVTNALAGSRVGGAIGYASVSMTGGSFKHTISIDNTAGASHAGLLFGDCARANTLAGITVDGSITSDANVKAGILIGGYNANTAAYTLGTADSPFTIKATASVNGTAVVSNPSIDADVVGDTATNAPAGNAITFANVKVE